VSDRFQGADIAILQILQRFEDIAKIRRYSLLVVELSLELSLLLRNNQP